MKKPSPLMARSVVWVDAVITPCAAMWLRSATLTPKTFSLPPYTLVLAFDSDITVLNRVSLRLNPVVFTLEMFWLMVFISQLVAFIPSTALFMAPQSISSLLAGKNFKILRMLSLHAACHKVEARNSATSPLGAG